MNLTSETIPMIADLKQTLAAAPPIGESAIIRRRPYTSKTTSLTDGCAPGQSIVDGYSGWKLENCG